MFPSLTSRGRRRTVIEVNWQYAFLHDSKKNQDCVFLSCRLPKHAGLHHFTIILNIFIYVNEVLQLPKGLKGSEKIPKQLCMYVFVCDLHFLNSLNFFSPYFFIFQQVIQRSLKIMKWFSWCRPLSVLFTGLLYGWVVHMYQVLAKRFCFIFSLLFFYFRGKCIIKMTYLVTIAFRFYIIFEYFQSLCSLSINMRPKRWMRSNNFQ